MDIETLMNQNEVLQVLNRFVRSVDNRDYVTMRACLADEVDFDYSALGRELARPAAHLIEQVRESHRALDGLQHLTAITLWTCRAIPPVVHATTSLLTSESSLSGNQCGSWPSYDYRLTRSAKVWRISYCKIHVAWIAGDKAVFE
jgi:hypothetical protein